MGQAHIFRFLQKYLIGFKLRLWLGLSRTFTELSISHSCSVLRVIVLLEGKPSAHLRFWMLWIGVSFWVFISIFWCIEIFFYSDEPLSSCRWKTASQHEAATSTLYFWDGTLQVMSRARFFQTWCLELRFIRPKNLVSQMFSFVFTEDRIESGHTGIKHRSVECCSDVCPPFSTYDHGAQLDWPSASWSPV